jgi:ADP-ribose pyrophosphatase YjhB (NUDIX family)
MNATFMETMTQEDQRNRRWQVLLDDQPIEKVGRLIIHAESFGTLAYGKTPAGYDGWNFREIGGGGVVILPFTEQESRLLVGVTSQYRYNQGGEVWNAPRGFLDIGETHDNAAKRELNEETGYTAADLIDLGGQPANPNSAFFDTATAGEGSRFYALRISESDLEVRDGVLRFAAGLVDLGEKAILNRLSERIGDTFFIPWQEAARLSDMFTNAAVSRLLAYLDRS